MQKPVKTGKYTEINTHSHVKFWPNWIKYGAVSYSLSCTLIYGISKNIVISSSNVKIQLNSDYLVYYYKLLKVQRFRSMAIIKHLKVEATQYLQELTLIASFILSILNPWLSQIKYMSSGKYLNIFYLQLLKLCLAYQACNLLTPK